MAQNPETEDKAAMEFILNHSPDVINQHIDVTVKAGKDQIIVFVCTKLDGISLADDPLDPPSVQYERSFSQVDLRSPSLKHTLVVTARDQNGKQESATKTWTD
jgi:hypothetical protein